jgi:hypothetical protein
MGEEHVVEEKSEQKNYKHVVGKGGGKKGSGDHVRQEMISSDYVERSGGGSWTIRFGEEVMKKQPFQGPGEGEEAKEVLGTMRRGKKIF